MHDFSDFNEVTICDSQTDSNGEELQTHIVVLKCPVDHRLWTIDPKLIISSYGSGVA